MRRRDILIRLALPWIAAFLFIGWVAAVVAWTGGHWGPSPWAVTASHPDWPATGFRWITGWVSTFLLVISFAGTAASISQALRRSEFRELHIALPGTELRMNPLRFAASLAPCAVTGFAVMFVTVALWGVSASRVASDALHAHYGPLGLTSFATWLGSVLLFACATWLAFSAARQSRALRQSCG
jgi:hypothetical protein